MCMMHVPINILTDDSALDELEGWLGIIFEKKSFLKTAFIHSSYKNENVIEFKDNQALEFLGDAVLGLIISDYTFDNYSDKTHGIVETITSPTDEGKYSDYRDKHIGTLLSVIADKLELDCYLLKGNGESKNIAGKESRLIDLMEALIGAIYKDKGYDHTKEFVLKYFLPHLEKSFSQMYENELDALNQKLENEPNNSLLFVAKGRIFGALNRTEEALKAMNKALEIEPENEEAVFIKLCYHDDLKEYEEALAAANKLISFYPEDGLRWQHKGSMLLNLGRTDEALEAYLKALEVDLIESGWCFPYNLYNIAKIYSLKRSKEEALLYLEKALKCQENYADSSQRSVEIKNDSINEKAFSWLLNDNEFKRITAE